MFSVATSVIDKHPQFMALFTWCLHKYTMVFAAFMHVYCIILLTKQLVLLWFSLHILSSSAVFIYQLHHGNTMDQGIYQLSVLQC